LACCFIDDNSRLHNRKIRGYTVLGGKEDLAKIIEKHNIRKIIVSFRIKGAEKRREIKALCIKMGAEIDVGQMKLIIT
jgi:FlaA1/EpsC-like NDP-sugar epimerase